MPPTGRQVRCLRCRTVWHAEPSCADKVLAAAAAIGPDRGVVAEASGLAERAGSQVASDSLTSAAGDNTQPAEDQAFASATTGEGDPGGFPDAPDDAAEVQAPPIAPNDFEGRPPIDIDDDDHADHRAAPPEDIETVAARQQRRSAAPTVPRWPLSLLQTGLLALVLVDVILIGWRHDIVRLATANRLLLRFAWNAGEPSRSRL